MSTHPYMPLYVDDYEAATTHLTAEEDGIYTRLLRLCWRTPGCSMPCDDGWIARRIRLSAADYERAAKPIILEFFVTKKGRIFQKRLKAEYESITQKKTARKKAGKVGGDAKALNRKEITISNATVLLGDTRALPDPEPYSEPKPEPKESKKKEDTPTQKNASGASKGDSSKNKSRLPEDFPTREAKAAAIKYWGGKGRLDLGAGVEDQADQFRDYHTANGSKQQDWPATWRTWVRNALQFTKPQNGNKIATTPVFEDTSPGGWRGRLEVYYFGYSDGQEGGRRSPPGSWVDKFGPKPGEAGCRVPAQVLKDFRDRLPRHAAE